MSQRQWRSDDTDKWIYAFGDGSAGTSYAVPANEGCSGTAGTKSLTLAAAGSFANGDLVLIHQSRGTGVGAWELNKIASGAGGTALTMVHDLINTYTDSGASQAQIIELNQYDGLTVSTSITADWDQSKGGIIAFLDKGTTTVTGTIEVNGEVGGDGTPGTGAGFYGGEDRFNADGIAASQGEGSAGAGSQTNAANGNGGGGGRKDPTFAASGAGGGGNGAAGTTGQTIGGSAGGTGGAADGNAALTDMVMGGGGGGGAASTPNPTSAGGAGGGLIFIFSKSIDLSGATIVSSNGGNGRNAEGIATGGSGGGAGGSILLKCETATLGTNKITASGGSGGSGSGGSGNSGAGGVGRIHIDYSTSYTGTTTPTIDATLDTTIIEPILETSSSGIFLTF